MHAFRYLFSLAALLSAKSLKAQLDILDWSIKNDVFDERYGTRGLTVELQCQYQGDRLLPVPSRLQLLYENNPVYADSSVLAVLVPGKAQTVRFFIPYRQIDLEAGEYEQIVVQYQCGDLSNWSEVLQLKQPPRLAIEIDLINAQVKQRLEKWDRGRNPGHWAPDPYWFITTGAGSLPVASVPDTLNSYDLRPQSLRFVILEGEQLYWHWFDEDGIRDDSLGFMAIPMASGDFKQERQNVMFGEIKNLHYVYAQKQLRRQPITLRTQADWVHQGRRGVRVEVEYHLARAYRNERVMPLFWSENNRGDTAQIPFVYALDQAPMPGQWLDLGNKVDGKFAYFIPFYFWDNNNQQLHISLQTQNGLYTRSAPLFLHQPIEFPPFLLYSGLEVQEGFRYKGASGLRLRLQYKVQELHRYSHLEIHLPDSFARYMDLYALEPNGSYRAVTEPVFRIQQPRSEDSIDFFIPYFSLQTYQLPLSMYLVPDAPVSLYKGIAAWADMPKELNDIVLELRSAENKCAESHYGHTVELRYRIPELLLPHARWNMESAINGVASETYRLLAPQLVERSRFARDSGSLSIVLPFRRLQQKDFVYLKMHISEQRSQKPLSPTVEYQWRMAEERNLVSLRLYPTALQWSDAARQAAVQEGGESPYVCIIAIGDEVLFRQSVPLSGRAVELEILDKTLLVHREDKLSLRIEHRDKKQPGWLLWQGDFGKMQQSGMGIKLNDKNAPLQKVVWKFKALKMK